MCCSGEQVHSESGLQASMAVEADSPGQRSVEVNMQLKVPRRVTPTKVDDGVLAAHDGVK